MSIYGLADCNNFFVSCERVFRPALEGRPAVVLSSNDGCIVARSDEAKALGVKMAQPAFQAKDLIERHSIAVISGNLPFYTDMSNRVMQAFGELVPAVEKYSIDCQWRSKKGPPRRCKKGPLGGCGLVPVVHGRAPRATRRALNRLTRRRAREGPVGPRGQAWAGWSVQLAVGV